MSEDKIADILQTIHPLNAIKEHVNRCLHVLKISEEVELRFPREIESSEVLEEGWTLKGYCSNRDSKMIIVLSQVLEENWRQLMTTINHELGHVFFNYYVGKLFTLEHVNDVFIRTENKDDYVSEYSESSIEEDFAEVFSYAFLIMTSGDSCKPSCNDFTPVLKKKWEMVNDLITEVIE